MNVYAGIGSRKLSTEEWNLCYYFGAFMAGRGWLLRTGAAEGADQAFAQGALSVGGAVILCLPWATYNNPWVAWAVSQGATVRVLQAEDERAYHSVDRFHPASHKLRQGGRALHARNWLIVAGVSFVLAWPKPDQYGSQGGTGQGLRICSDKGVKVFNLNDATVLATVQHELNTVRQG